MLHLRFQDNAQQPLRTHGTQPQTRPRFQGQRGKLKTVLNSPSPPPPPRLGGGAPHDVPQQIKKNSDLAKEQFAKETAKEQFSLKIKQMT